MFRRVHEILSSLFLLGKRKMKLSVTLPFQPLICEKVTKFFKKKKDKSEKA